MINAAKIIVLSCILFLMPLCALSQDMNFEEKNDVALEVFQLTQSLEELILLLKDQNSRDDQYAELQKLEIAVNYLTFRSRRIEAKEQNLMERRFSRKRDEETISRIKKKVKQKEKLNETLQEPDFKHEISEENSPHELLRILRQNIEQFDSEIIILENEIMAMTANLAEIEAYVENNLR
ncbi:MAG: hypothetical protein RQ767_05220 [Thermovirgaceae bacterium]|nr:hypothetical protein [Thermovirgaceae bacterium]